MSFANFTVPPNFKACSFATVTMMEAGNAVPFPSYLAINHRGELVSIPAGYLGTLCLNIVLRKGETGWHLTGMCTHTLQRKALKTLFEKGEVLDAGRLIRLINPELTT